MTGNMASLLEQALATLVRTFQEYSQFSGNPLCQAKFKELLEKEVANYSSKNLENPLDRGAWLAPVHGATKESNMT